MPVAIRCPNPACARVTQASDEVLSRRVKCPGCGQTFVATASSTSDGGSDKVQVAKKVPPAPQAAQTIGRFVVRSKLGAGAFGAVYRAYDPQLEREVALKVPHAAVLDNPRRVERFLREAKAAANLRHPHIVPVFDAGKDGGHHYIASAFIAGQKLADVVEEDRGMEFGRAARLARELAEALAYAHGEGVVHRDVKPDNVMLDAAGRVHLMDFGLAARADEESKLTTDGSVMGTPSYMAPEQAAGDTAKVGPASDQYACGVVLYELLTGRTPFGGPVPVVIFNQIHTDPDPPSKYRPDVPRDLETICLKAMAKRPEDRYADCAALAGDLRRWSEGELIAARKAGAAERAVRWAKRNPAVSSLSAAVVLALACGAAVAGYFAVAAGREAVRANLKADEADENAGRAEREAEAAREAEGKARQAEGKAREAEGQARKEAERAEREKKAADEQRLRAEEQLDRAERLVYAGKISQARLALQGGQGARARWYLDQCRWDLRGWEHRHLWMRTLNNESRQEFLGHSDTVTSVAYSPDGTRVLTGSDDNTAKVWDAETGRELLTLRGHKQVRMNRTQLARGGVGSAVFRHDGKRIVTASVDGTAKVWDAATGKEVLSIKVHEGRVTRAVFSPDGARIATIAEEIKPSGGVARSSEVKVWDAETGRELLALEGVKAVVTSASFSPDGKRILTGGRDRRTRVWDVDTGKSIPVLQVDHKRGVTSATFSPDGSRILVVTDDGAVTVARQSPRGFSPTDQFSFGKEVYRATFSPDGKRIVTGSVGGVARVWDAGTGAELLVLKCTSAGLTAVGFSPDGKRIVTGSTDKSARVWDAEAGPDLLTQKQYDLAARGVVALSPDGTRVLAMTLNGPKVWDAGTGKEVLSLNGPGSQSGTAAYSPDGKRMLTLDAEGVKVWEAEKGQRIFSFARPPAMNAACLALSPDGKRILAGTQLGKGSSLKDPLAKVWDAETGKELVALKGHTYEVHCAAYSPDGTRLLTGSRDGTARLWDATTGQERFVLRAEGDSPRLVASGGAAQVWTALG